MNETIKGFLDGYLFKTAKGLGRMGGSAEGPGGNCTCPECGTTIKHKTGTPCYNVKCPNCGTKMTR
jgi:hypothetical protein